MTSSYIPTQDQDQNSQKPGQSQPDDIIAAPLAGSDSGKLIAQVLPIESADPQGRSGSSVADSHFKVRPSRVVKPARQLDRSEASPDAKSQNKVPPSPLPRPTRVVTPVPHRPHVAMPILPVANGKAKPPLPPTNGHTQNGGAQWSGAQNQRNEAE